MSDVPRLQSPEQPYLTFRVGTQWYAVDVAVVFEVANLVAISEVPDMPAAIVGVVNIRGNVVPIIDLRIRFKMTERALELTTPIIFLYYSDDRLYGIIVDDVDDVVLMAAGAIADTTLQQRARHITGMTDHEGRLIMILDPVLLMQSTLADEELVTVFDKIEN